MWTWEKTHQLLSDYLRLLRKNEITDEKLAELKANITKEMEQEFEASKIKDYSVFNRDQKFWLAEHFYQEEVDEEFRKTIDKVIANLEAINKSERKDKLEHYFKTYKTIYIENPKTPDYENMKLHTYFIPELKQISIMASPDFGAIFGDNNYTIIDWKTGKETEITDEITDQLKVYALKVFSKKWKKDLGEIVIKAHEVYLPSLNSKWWTITQEDIDYIINKISQDADFQKQFLVDQDPIKNKALPHTSFKRTTSAKKCATCTLRKVCEELKNFE